MRRLSEFEDRLLAMCEGEWMDRETGQSILRSWFAGEFSVEKFGAAVERLCAAGLLERHAGNPDAVEMRSTAAGSSI